MRQRAELHLHSEFSTLDGLGKIPQYVAAAKRRGITALGLMDHGQLGGVFEHYHECRTNDIEPVLGEEFYYVPSVAERRAAKSQARFHVGILGKGEKGYRVLKELNDAAHSQFYGKAIIDRPLLEQLGKDARHLVCLSGCAGSVISQAILNGDALIDNNEAADELKWWIRTFPNFYIELQHHGQDTDTDLTLGLLDLAVAFDLPTVITNDCHYVKEEDAGDHDAILAIGTNAEIDDPDRFRFEGDGYHLRTRAELRRQFVNEGFGTDWTTEGLNNSLAIAKDCRTRIPSWENRTWHIPAFPGTNNAYRTLVSQTKSGLRKLGLLGDPAYVAQAKHELTKIRETGIADFLLIVGECNTWARAQGIRVGPGRGSACGSLVSMAVGIHTVDPLKADLKFERFLNPERPKMPDVDTDYQPSRRDEVVQHMKELYGEENVIQVAAYQTMGVKGVFRKLAKANGITYPEQNRLAKLLNIPAWHDQDDEDDSQDDAGTFLPAELEENYPDLYRQMRALLGTKSGISSHAAGLLIFDKNDPIKDLVPKMWLTNQKRLAASFDLKSTEKMGLMKDDKLVLRTLDTIQLCVDFLKAKGIEIEPNDWVMDSEPGDRDVYRMLASGRTAGVFQMEGQANSRGIQDIKCSRFEDIVACTSLYRAGPIGAGAPGRYLENKRGRQIRVAHPLLKPILKNSWGEMIYQEQMMEICHEIAGFSWTETDDVKETVRFKDADRMATFKDRFLEGCATTSGLDPETAATIWSMIESQSTYLFNRSHAYAYSIVTYQTARLKHLYPLEYMTAYLATVKPNSDSAKARRQRVLAESHEMGFKILPPDVNKSYPHMCCGENEDGKWMRFGFVDIKGVGESSAAKLMAQREDGFYRMSEVSILDKRTLDALAMCGALTSIGGPRVSTRQMEKLVEWDWVDRMGKFRAELRPMVKFPDHDGQWCQIAGELVSKESRTTKTGKTFKTWILKWDPATRLKVCVWQDAMAAWDTPVGSIVAVEGKYSRDFDNVGVNDSDFVTVLARRKDGST